MRRLIREGDPPAGQLASPVPQYWNPNTEAFEDVLGAHGAPRAILYGPNGQPISQSNPLPIEGKVQLTGQIPSGSNIIGRIDTVGSSVVVETLLDAESVLPGTENRRGFQVDIHGYDACYLAVSTDKAPWVMNGSVGPFTIRGNVSANAFYPSAGYVTETSTSTFPRVFLFTTVINGNTPHESFEDAWRHRWRGDGHGPLWVYFTNRSSDTATVTVKAIKVKGG